MNIEDISKGDYIFIDGPLDREFVKSMLDNLGDLPTFIESGDVIKAFGSSNVDVTDLVSKARNIANLVAVKRMMVSKNGRAYMKTVYVKKEEIEESPKTKRFLEQHETEAHLSVGDKVTAKFKGYSTGAEYEFDHFKVKTIGSDKVTLEFTKPFRANANYTYSIGTELVIPKSSSPDWNPETSLVKFKEPTPEPAVAEMKVVESIDDISVGDEVLVKQRGDSPDLPGEIRYIHPRGNFIDIKVGTKVLRRKLGRFSVGTAPAAQELTMGQISALEQHGVEVTIAGARSISRTDRSRNIGTEEYQASIRVDRFGNPNDRGRSRRHVTRNRPAYYQRTDAEMAALQGSHGADTLAKFNETFGGFNIEEYAIETRSAIRAAYPSMSDSDIGPIKISLESSGNFRLNIDNNKFRMTRAFRAMDKSVYHQYFAIKNRGAQGAGLGKGLFKALYRQYKKSGVKTIGVSANINVGGYAWGRYGFTASTQQAATYVRSFESNVGRTKDGYTITQEDAQNARRVYDDWTSSNESGARFPMNLLCCIGPNNQAGKNILLNTSWSGSLDLQNTRQRTHFENYIGFSG